MHAADVQKLNRETVRVLLQRVVEESHDRNSIFSLTRIKERRIRVIWKMYSSIDEIDAYNRMKSTLKERRV